jgi:FHA domain-containing protein/trypsin-like peptidase
VRLLRLRYASGRRRGEELIFSGPRVRIGRSRDNTLVLTEADPPISSAHHADAMLDRGAWWIVDAGSTNGTFVNGAPVQRHRLRKGDVVAFGQDQFVVSAVRSRAWLWAVAAAAIGAAVAAGFVTYRRATPHERVASKAARSVYAVVIEDRGTRTIAGTAFAVTGDALATNAHVVDVLRQRDAIDQRTSTRALAIRGDVFDRRPIVGTRLHGNWRPGSIRDDVALLLVERGEALTPLMLADAGAFTRLRRGMTLASFGFPAVSTDAQHPRGRLSVDIVGDVRGDYLQAGLSIAPGTSGSPVFDDSGSVVAIVAGGDFVAGVDGRMTPSGSQANWAITIDRVRELLEAR